MMHLGLFKGVCKLKLTKILVVILFSGAIFNISLLTSSISGSTCRDNTGGSSGNIHVHDRSLEDKIHTGDTGGRTLNVTLVKNEKTRRYIIPLKESGKDKNAHQVPGLDKSAKVPEQFPLLNSTSHKSRSSIGAKPLSIFSPSLQKQMISTMHRTVHIAAWGKIFHLCGNKTVAPPVAMKVSVVITFHESEKLVRLLHTIHSIFQRTPPQLLHEIILIDDHGKREEFREILLNYINSVFRPKIKLHNNWLKVGLIGARLAGTRLAEGDVIVCMDSHMEVQEKWLEPLLVEIHKNPKTLAASYLDWMEHDTAGQRWKYRYGASSWKTYFDWTFTFGFQDISYLEKARRDPVEPVESPVTIGTIFAIKTQFFRDIGEFDDGMVGWGGENLDLPLRVWMFGGRVVNVPCSHVAHYEEMGHRNYRIGWEKSITRNYRRVAEVWLGNYTDLVMQYKDGIQTVDPGDLTSRHELRKKAIYDFSWYLKNVFPELGVPHEHSLAWGGVQNVAKRFCLYSASPSSPVIMDCVLKRPDKTGFFWSDTGELRFPLHAFSGKVGYFESPFRVDEWINFYNTSRSSKWFHWKGGPLIEWNSRQCLTTYEKTFRLKLVECDFNSTYQQWKFIHYTESYRQLQEPIEGAIPSRFTRDLNEVLHWKNTGQWDKLYHFTWHRNPT